MSNSTDPDTMVAVQTWIDGTTGVAEIARPEKFNCLSTEVWQGLEAALASFENDATVRAMLIVSKGKQFCTGADLDEVLEVRKNAQRLSEFLGLGNQVIQRLAESPLPIVCAVQGLALAGGIELVLACDVVFAGKSARFGDQHAQFGLVPGWGGSQRLTRTIGLRRALDLFYTARWLDAQTALDYGLVNYLVDRAELRPAALEYCYDLGKRSRGGLATMKRLAREGMEMALYDGVAMEHATVTQVLLEADASEGLAAFQERRDPIFP